MEGPTVPSDSRDAQSAEEDRFEKGRRSPSPYTGSVGLEKFSKINF